MTGFLMGGALIALVALAILTRPLIWRRAQSPPTRQRANAAVYRDQLARLDQDLADGSLGGEEYARARDELEGRALADLPEHEPASQWRAPRATLVTLAIAIPVAAAALYLLIGNAGALSASNAPHDTMVGNSQIEQMVTRLAARLEQNPSDKKGWLMLARSYKVLGRLPEAERAYDKAGDAIDGNAQELANYADAAAANANGRFAGKPTQLIEKALRADPDNPMALWLAGSAARDRGDVAGALRFWEKLLGLLAPDSEDARELKSLIERVRP